MGVDKIGADFADMQAAETEIKAIYEEYKQLYEDIIAKNDQMVEVWEGVDYKQFDDQIKAQKPTWDKMHQLLVGAETAMRTSRETYQHTQEDIRSGAAGLQVGW